MRHCARTKASRSRWVSISRRSPASLPKPVKSWLNSAVDQRLDRDQFITELGERFDIAQFLFEADYGNGTGTLSVGVIELDGELRLIGFSLECPTCPTPG